MRFIRILNILLGALFSVGVPSQIARSAPQQHSDALADALSKCADKNPGNPVKLMACRSPEIAIENAKLNTVLIRLRGLLTPYQRTLLAKSQKTWLAFRDSECELQSSRLIGGAMGIIAFDQVYRLNQCLIEQTRSRANQLRDDYADIKDAGQNGPSQ